MKKSVHIEKMISKSIGVILTISLILATVLVFSEKAEASGRIPLTDGLLKAWSGIPTNEDQEVEITYYPNGSGHDGDENIRKVTFTYRTQFGVYAEYNLFSGSEHEFVHWNTEKDNSGDIYLPGDSLDTFIENGGTTLYAIWRSCEPEISLISIVGFFIVGEGVPGSTIYVQYPDGTGGLAIVQSNGIWVMIIPSNMTLEMTDYITAVQIETDSGKLESNPVEKLPNPGT